MEELINKISLIKYHLVLAGDLNIDLLEYSHNNKCKDFVDLMISYYLYPKISKPFYILILIF